MDGFLLHEALEALWEVVGDANRFVEAQQPWSLARGDQAARDRLRGVLGDLLETCRVVALAVAPFMPTVAARVSAQLGIDYGYDARGQGGPPLAQAAAWGSAPPGRIGEAEILFPRIEVD